MKLNLAASAGVKVRVLEYAPADIVTLVSQGGNALDLVTEAVNADRRQKVALVDFRYDLSARIGDGDAEAKITGLGFKRKMKTVTKDGETSEVPDETEGDHIKRFIDALVDGSFSPDGFTLPSGDDKQKETAAFSFLQTLAFQCGDKKTDDGLPCYMLDVNRPVIIRQGPGIPKYALEAADVIIKNGTQAKWKHNFQHGFTTRAGIALDPVPHDAFDVVAPHGSTPEEHQKVHENNRKALARAIQAAKKQEESKAGNEFV